MYVVTVNFEIKSEQLAAFKAAMQTQAQNSLELESECHVFDVCYNPEASNHCFLYELYSDKTAFDVHLASDHFQTFNQLVTDWVISKAVNVYQREWPSVPDAI